MSEGQYQQQPGHQPSGQGQPAYGSPSYGSPSYGSPSYGTPPQGQPFSGQVSWPPPADGQVQPSGPPVSYPPPPPSAPAYGYGGYAAQAGPYGPIPIDPYTGRPLSPKSKIAAGLLQIFLGVFGVGRFYMGSTGIAVAQLLLTVVGFVTSFIGIGIVLLWGVALWALIDGIVILAGQPTDREGRLMR